MITSSSLLSLAAIKVICRFSREYAVGMILDFSVFGVDNTQARRYNDFQKKRA
jgi:hypothetical protein